MRPVRPVLIACAAGLLGGCTAAPIEIATVGQGALTDELLAHWALDEGTGSAAADTSGNGHNGVLQGPGLSWMTGRFGSALHFSGTDMVAVTPFPQATTNYTVSAWVSIASTEVGAPIANLVSTEVLGGGWALFANLSNAPGAGPKSYEFEFAIPPTPTMPTQAFTSVTCACVVTDKWVHLAAVLDGDHQTLTLYTSEAPPATAAAPAPMLPGSGMLEIGHSTRQELGAAFPVTGSIDDVAIYQRALAPDEIDQLGKAPVPVPN